MTRLRLLTRALGPGSFYAVVAALSIALSRVNGGFALFWIANGLLVPWILTRPQRNARPALLGVAAATLLITSAIGLGWRAAPLMALANTLETWLATKLVHAAYRRFRTYTSVRAMLATYAAGAVIAPLASALPAGLAIYLATGASLGTSFGQWTLAHGLGFLAVYPCAGLLIQARARHRSVLPPAQRRAALIALGAVLIAGLVCFGQSRVPMLFLPILVLMYTMSLTDLFVSALALTMLLVMGLASAFMGVGPLGLVAVGAEQRFLFVQFYAACVSLTAMPIALMLERRRRMYAALAESEARFRLLADFSTDIIMVTGADGRIKYVSPSIRQLGDWEPARLTGGNTDALIAAQHRGDVAAAHIGVIARPGTTASVEFLGVTRASGVRWFESHLRAILREDGEVEGVCSIIRDISQRKRREAELRAVALTDALTGLANRRAFEMFMNTAQDDRVESYLALFDLDHFKKVNDTHGHEAGDRVLKAFARAARSATRESDLVARIGGEEFVVHLHDTTLDRARLVCERIGAALAREAQRGAPEVGRVTASVGLSRLDGPLEAVLRRADVALYNAKAAGRDRLSIAA